MEILVVISVFNAMVNVKIVKIVLKIVQNAELESKQFTLNLKKKKNNLLLVI